MPIRLDDGSHPGTLCVVDFQPRELSEHQREALLRLADAAAEALMMRERAMAAGQGSEPGQAFAVLAETAPLGVFRADASGRFIYTNTTWQEVAGLTAAEALGDGWAATLAPDDRAEVLHQWRRSIERRETFEMRYRVRRDGGMRQVAARARPLSSDTGLLCGYVGIVEDVTDRITAERELRESKALLDRTGRLIDGVLNRPGFELPPRSLGCCQFHGHRPKEGLHNSQPGVVVRRDDGNVMLQLAD